MFLIESMFRDYNSILSIYLALWIKRILQERVVLLHLIFRKRSVETSEIWNNTVFWGENLPNEGLQVRKNHWSFSEFIPHLDPWLPIEILWTVTDTEHS